MTDAAPPPPGPLLPRARTVSRALVGGALLLGPLARRAADRPGGGRAQTALVLGALVLGMPHGAADTEVLRAAAGGDRRRHGGLLAGYAAAGAVGTAYVARGGRGARPVVLLGSLAHFVEGELSCWAPATGTPLGRRGDALLRAAAAGLGSLGLQAAVAWADPERTSAGLSPDPAVTGGARTGLVLLRAADVPAGRRAVLVSLTTATAGASLLLAKRGDRAVAVDTALLGALALATPPAVSFSAYFGGWHALRHTARVADHLIARGALPATGGLARAGLRLAARSSWAAAVGVAAAGLLVARQPERAADAGLAAAVGLTLPHAVTVARLLVRDVSAAG